MLFRSTPKSSDPKMDAALVKLQDWVHELEARLPLESDRAVEKLLASIEKPGELSSKLWDILAQSEQQFEPDEKSVFGAPLDKFSLEDRRKLVMAWTSKLKELLRKRVEIISGKLANSENPKAKELSEAVKKLSHAHFEGYEQYEMATKTSLEPKLFCFACDGHIGEFNYHENMDEKVKNALAGWGSTGNIVSQAPPDQTETKPKEKTTIQKNKAITPPGEGSYEKYKETLVNGRPNPNMYPQPENMAPVLGLTNPDGISYMKWKGKGQHFVRGPQGNEYGVEVNWDLIRKQSLEEQKRVLNILENVLKGGVSQFKVVRPNNDGYCLWCNIGNYPPSKNEMNSLRARVAGSRK